MHTSMPWPPNSMASCTWPTRWRQADLDGVEPLAHPHEQTLALRDDAVTEPDRADAFLALAPESRGGLFLVPKVLE